MTEKKDESFEIISLKEKFLKDQLAISEDALIKSEFNVRINKLISQILREDIKEESNKNAH